MYVKRDGERWRWRMAALLQAALLPLVLGAVLHYGFVTNFSTISYSQEGIEERYSDTVFKYRILGRDLLLLLDEVMGETPPAFELASQFLPLQQMDTAADPSFYQTLAMYRTIGLLLVSLLLWWTLLLPRFALSLQGLAAAHGFLLLLVVLSLYVITPYDLWTYAFLLLGARLLLHSSGRLRWLLPLIMIPAVLNHESAIMLVGMLFAILWMEKRRQALASPELWLTIAAWLLPFLLMRLLTDGWADAPHRRFPSDRSVLLHAENFTGILFILILTGLGFVIGRDRRLLTVFTICATPYLLSVLIYGNLWELRLWLPYLLPFLLFAMLPEKTMENKPIQQVPA